MFLSKKLKKQQVELQGDSLLFSKTRYNILLLVDKIDYNDKSKYIVDTANYLIKNDVGVVILTNKCFIRNLIDIKVNVLQIALKDNNYIGKIKNVKTIKNICKKYNIDVINAYDLYSVLMANSVCKELKMPFIATICEIYDISSRWKKHMANVITKANKVVCFSYYACLFVINNFKIDRSKIELNIHGLNIDEFLSKNVKSGRVADVARMMNVEMNNRKIFLYPCSFVENYDDIQFLFKVLGSIKKDNFLFILFGQFDGTKRNRISLIKKIYELKLSNKIMLIDKITDICPVYLLSYATIFLTKKATILNRCIIESCLLKRPVIATDNGCLPNYIVDGGSGFLVKRNSFIETKKAIEDMLNLTDSEYKEMCENAYKYATKYFDINKNLPKLDAMFFELSQHK